MVRVFRRLWDIFSGTVTIWGLLPSTWQGAGITLFSVVTAYFGFQAGGLFYAFLGGGAMFLFGTAGAYYALLLNRQTSIFRRLVVEEIGVIQFAVRGDKEKKEFFIKGLTMEVHLRNLSEREIWLQLRRVNHSFSNLTTDGDFQKIPFAAPPHAQHKFTLATLPDIPLPTTSGAHGPTGSIDLEILYGPKRDDLRYVLYYICKPMTSLQMNTETGEGQLMITFPITRYEHERLS